MALDNEAVVSSTTRRTTNLADTTSTTTSNLPDPSFYKELRARLWQENPRSNRWTSCIDCLGWFIFVGLVCLMAMLVWEVVIPTQKQRIYYSVLGTTLIPVLLATYTALRPNKPVHERLTPVVVVATIFSQVLPRWVKASVAALGLFAFALVSRPRDHNKDKSSNDKGTTSSMDDDNDDEKKKLLSPSPPSQRHKKNAVVTMSRQSQLNLTKAAGCGVFLLIIFGTENFLIWVVSATYQQSWNPQTAPEPLQDNGRRVLEWFFFRFLDLGKGEVVSMRRAWNIQYALVVAFGATLATIDFHPTRQLWSLASRAIMTLACARALRTVSFLLTVLPSQNKFCYVQHFPNPPPTDWWEWTFEGLKPMSHGGCNDLIISGHATVTSTMAAVAISMANENLFSVAICWLLAMDYCVEIYEGFHYSVDMWMGAIICGLLWRVWKPIEDNNTDRNTDSVTLQDLKQRLFQDRLTFLEILTFGGPAMVSFLQLTILPESIANFTLLGMVAAAVTQIAVSGFQQYTKYLFLCVVYTATGIYL
jgi:PAP2 superfamily C-terminal